jgi:hypothetical protein
MFVQWLDDHLDPDWRVAYKLHSLWACAFWSCVVGAYMALPAFQEYMTPFHFLGVCIFGSVTIGIARLTNQPGVS